MHQIFFFLILLIISCSDQKKVLIERPYLKQELKLTEQFDPINNEYYLNKTWVDIIDSLSLESYLKEINNNYEKFILYSPESFLWTHRRFKSRPKGEETIYPQWKSRDKRRKRKRQARR